MRENRTYGLMRGREGEFESFISCFLFLLYRSTLHCTFCNTANQDLRLLGRMIMPIASLLDHHILDAPP